MHVRAIVLCGGEGERWNNYLGVQKHFVPIDDKPLLRTTVDHLRSGGVADIVVAGRGDAYKIEGTQFLHVPKDDCTRPAEKFNSSRQLWAEDGSTVLLFGDVSYSCAAMDAVLETHPGTINFVGRLTASRITGCRSPEIFAVSFDHTAHVLLDAALDEIAKADAAQPTGWQLYRILADRAALNGLGDGLRLKFTHIDDLTEDFDYPEDYTRWVAHRATGHVVNVQRADQIRRKAEKRKWQKRAQLALVTGLASGAVIAALLLG